MSLFMAALDAALIAAGLMALTIAAFLMLECVLGQSQATAAAREPPALQGNSNPAVQFTVLMPAHNEAAGIGACIAAVQTYLGDHGKLLVVADNCTDDTAAIAQQAGAQVVERKDPAHRGKGYALAAGIEAMRQAPPDVVVILDADCTVSHGSLIALAHRAHELQRPQQALYRMLPSPGAGLGQRVGAFAWRVKNELRARGAVKLGIPCPLMGAGMAFPWKVISESRLASGNIVEDLQMGIDMALAGSGADWMETVTVESTLPDSTAAAAKQRARWEHGTLSTIRQQVPRIVRAAFTKRRLSLLGLALDVAVPPLAFLAVATTGLVALQAAWSWLGGNVLALALGLMAMAFLVITLAVAWWSVGRALVPAGQLVQIPIYVLRKIPSYARWLSGRGEREWVRTQRNGKP